MLLSTDSLFLFTFFFAPALGIVVYLTIRFTQKCMARVQAEDSENVSIHVVEPVNTVQQIHAIEPLAIAESVATEIDQQAQFALTLHVVQSGPLPQHGTNQESLNI
jgi:hypothetical protein